MEVFLWGKDPIFMLPAAKSRWLIFKKNNGIARIRETS